MVLSLTTCEGNILGNGYSDVVNKWLGRQKKVLLMTREGNTVGNGYSDVVYEYV